MLTNVKGLNESISSEKRPFAALLWISSRASENFWGCLAQSPPKNLGQIVAALAISGIFERFSPGPNGPEVGRQITLNSLTGPPTSGPFGPGENRSKMPEIARAAGIWPKFFGGDWGRHPQKFSLALIFINRAGFELGTLSIRRGR